MTWIKPSFLWMKYHCGWATKPGQEHVLSIRMSREGFEQAISMSCLSHFDAAAHGTCEQWQRSKSESPVRVQWDPECTTTLAPLPWRAIQIGLSGPAAREYARNWILSIDDITPEVHHLREQKHIDAAQLPQEHPYEPAGSTSGVTTHPTQPATTNHPSPA